jgi:hypothetical protein
MTTPTKERLDDDAPDDDTPADDTPVDPGPTTIGGSVDVDF